MNKIPERNEQLKKGLHDMIAYINKFHDTKELTILEIGSWTGVSAEIFCQNFKYVVCIDPWKATEGINRLYDMEEVEKIFDERMSKYSNFVKEKKTSKSFNDLVKKRLIDGKNLQNMINKEVDYNIDDKKIDIIYIDGLHTYEAVKEDLLLWKDFFRLYITGHDYWPKKFPGVVKAVNEIIGKPDKIFSDTSWLKKII